MILHVLRCLARSLLPQLFGFATALPMIQPRSSLAGVNLASAPSCTLGLSCSLRPGHIAHLTRIDKELAGRLVGYTLRHCDLQHEHDAQGCLLSDIGSGIAPASTASLVQDVMEPKPSHDCSRLRMLHWTHQISLIRHNVLLPSSLIALYSPWRPDYSRALLDLPTAGGSQLHHLNCTAVVVHCDCRCQLCIIVHQHLGVSATLNRRLCTGKGCSNI